MRTFSGSDDLGQAREQDPDLYLLPSLQNQLNHEARYEYFLLVWNLVFLKIVFTWVLNTFPSIKQGIVYSPYTKNEKQEINMPRDLSQVIRMDDN